MSIQSEIKRIKDNVTSAFLECQNKGATIPEVKNSDNLSGCIQTILTPSGNISITKNGDFDVTQYATANVKVAGASGVGIPLEVTPEKTLTKVQTPYVFNSGDVKKIGQCALQGAFYTNYYSTGLLPESQNNIKEIILPNVEEIAEHGLEKVTGIVTDENYYYTRTNILDTFQVPKLRTIAHSGLRQAFTDSSLKTVEFPELLSIGDYGCYGAFGKSLHLNNIFFPKLETIAPKSFVGFMAESSQAGEVHFPKLKLIQGDGTFYNAFGGNSNRSIYFDGLTTESFPDGVDSAFRGMLNQSHDCTIHFPTDLEDTLSASTEVFNLMGARSGAMILYDLSQATLHFNISNATNYEIWVEGKNVGNDYKCNSKDKEYAIVDLDKNNIVYGNVTSIPSGGLKNIDVDMLQQYTKVYAHTSEPNSSVKIKINGALFDLTQENETTYCANIFGADTAIQYEMHKDGFGITTGEVQYTQQELHITDYLYKATLIDYNLKALKDNGVFGESDFAVRSDLDPDNAYKAFDWDSSYERTFWHPGYDSRLGYLGKGYLDMYYKNPTNIKRVSINLGSYDDDIAFYGQNGKYYDLLGKSRKVGSAGGISFPDNTNFYNVYRLKFSNCAIHNISLSEKIYKYNRSLLYCVVPKNSNYKIMINDIELSKSETGYTYKWFEDGVIADNSVFKVVENGVDILTRNLDYSGYVDKNCYKIDINFTQNLTLTINANEPIKNVDYLVDGVKSDTTGNVLTSFKGSHVKYTVYFENASFSPCSGELFLVEDTTLDVRAVSIKVTLDVTAEEGMSQTKPWLLDDSISIPGYTMYKSGNKDISSSESIMRIDFSGLDKLEYYINSYAESRYDYTMASNVIVEGETSITWDISTSGFQCPPSDFPASYKLVTYEGLDKSQKYHCYVKFRKDSSGSYQLDEGRLAINLNQ